MSRTKRIPHPSIPGRLIVIEHRADEAGGVSDLGDPDRYAGLPHAERERYEAQDRARLAAYARGDWWYIGVCVSIRQQTASNWADGGLEIGRASLWGIESDSDAEYIASTEQEITREAEAEVERLRAALGGG